jgi:hypothetical protein
MEHNLVYYNNRASDIKIPDKEVLNSLISIGHKLREKVIDIVY